MINVKVASVDEEFKNLNTMNKQITAIAKVDPD